MKLFQKIKRNIIKAALIFSIPCVAIFLWLAVVNNSLESQACAFCDPGILTTQTFYEDEYVRGICPDKPIQPLHCLIVTKRHIERFEESTQEEMVAMWKLIKKVNDAVQKLNGESSYLLLQKNGSEVGQTVPHVHIHYIPKKVSSSRSVAVFGLLWNFIFSPFKWKLPKTQIEENVAIIRETIN